jgi:hypothetical protein
LPQHRQPDGSASDDDATIRDGRFDLAGCEAKRRLLVEEWPRPQQGERYLDIIERSPSQEAFGWGWFRKRVLPA